MAGYRHGKQQNGVTIDRVTYYNYIIGYIGQVMPLGRVRVSHTQISNAENL